MVQWLAYVTRLGVLLRPEVDEADTLSDPIFLGGAAREEPIDPIHLALRLDDKDVAALACPGNCAATHYGPVTQEKSLNEDFAAACVFQTADGPVAFATVADGISNGVFWPARTSRIAALCALQTARLFVNEAPPSPTRAREFVIALIAALRTAYEADRDALNKAKVRDPDWSPSVYDDFVDDPQTWYGSTLLVALFGAHGGFCVHAGDGAIIEVIEGKQSLTITPLLQTGPGSVLSEYVWLRVDQRMFTALPLQPSASPRHILLASDGLDRTLQKKKGLRSFLDLPALSAEDLFKAIDETASEPGAEQDNMSAARASFPLEDVANRWRKISSGAYTVTLKALKRPSKTRPKSKTADSNKNSPEETAASKTRGARDNTGFLLITLTFLVGAALTLISNADVRNGVRSFVTKLQHAMSLP